ncbi:porin [Halomonas caseinilytica]|uniref:Outer membrane protein (Porin) n=1 Tax=Halomonas caseinilytica TaxID=438744 RepID=A0A1M6RTU6_9GAMM|nr:porin [Halomonas caseinilytica]SHK35941.1 Outer membrane protein (porin) [Halomonas caseinilytica]
MKKTLLATAIAGAMVASGAQAATVYNQDGTKLDIYGNVQIGFRNIENDVSEDGEPANIQTENDVFDNGSTIGFAAEHVIYDGLTGYMKIEFDDFKADEMKTAGRDAGDTAYVGLKGNFGDLKLGSYDTLMDDWIQDPVTNNEYFDLSDTSGSGAYETAVDGMVETDQLTYVSPSFSGLQLAVGTQYKGDMESENVDNGGNASVFGGAKYTVGNFSVAAMYDNLDNYEVTEAGMANNQEFGDRYGVTGQYQWNTLRVALKYERFESDIDNVDSTNFYGLGARYGYGNGDIYGAYQYVDVGGDTFGNVVDDSLSGDSPSETASDRGDDTYNEFIVGGTYNISDAMYTWLEAAFYDREDDEGDGVAAGVTYMF